MFRRFLAAFTIAQCLLPAGWAWNAHGHRTITYLALDGMGEKTPAWLKDAKVRDRVAFQSSEPDRWRSTSFDALNHENKMDHFLDIEDLESFGLTLETLPPLRYEYLRALAVAKHVHPEQIRDYDASKDADRTKEWPGFIAHEIVEHYAKLQCAFNQVRILEQINDPNRAFQLEQARENALYHMGVLSHFVGDAAQPLHTTRHFNGWVGDNPGGYTTSNKFHSYIDGGVLEKHAITYATLRAGTTFDRKVDARKPWDDVLAHIRRAHEQMEPTYKLEKSGDLDQQPGKELIEARIRDGATMLAALYAAAWETAAPNAKQIADFQFYDELKAESLPGREPAR